MKHCLPFLGFLTAAFLASPIAAQQIPAQRIADINSASSVTGSGRLPKSVDLQAPNPTFFYAFSDRNGEELWGTVSNPAYGHMIRDIHVGRGSADISNLTPTSIGAFFFANSDPTTRSLWYSDGTSEGTRVVGAPIGSSSPLSGLLETEPKAITRSGSTVFVTFERAGNTELWFADESNLDSAVQLLVVPGVFRTRTAMGGTRYFGLWTTNVATRLIASDGTPASSSVVRSYPDMPTQALGIRPTEFEIASLGTNRVAFTAYDTFSAIELWSSSGTPASTQLVADVYPGNASSEPKDFVTTGSLLYYSCLSPTNGRELWSSNSFTNGTGMVVDMDANGSSNPKPLGFVPPRLILTAGANRDLFSWDGNFMTLLGHPGQTVEYAQVRSDGGLLYFSTGSAVWATNGNTWFSFPMALNSPDPGRVVEFFSLPNGVDGFIDAQPLGNSTIPGSGRSLWLFDTQLTSARRVREMTPDWREGDSSPSHFYRNGNQILFGAATDGGLGSLNSLDLTNGTVTPLASMFPPPSEFVKLDSGAITFVSGTPATGTELFATLGLPQVFVQPEIRPGPASSNPRDLVKAGQNVFLSADDGIEGREIYYVNNAQVPTRLAVIGPPGPRGSDPEHLMVIGDRLYFSAYSTAGGRELWTWQVFTGLAQIDIAPGTASSSPSNLTEHAGSLYLVANTGSGRCLCRYDPANGLIPLTTPTNNPAHYPDHLTSYNAMLLFTNFEAATGRELWRTSGTPLSTYIAADIVAGVPGCEPQEIVVAGGYAWIVAVAPLLGYELYKSDGTGVGTNLALDINPTGSSYPYQLTNYRDTLVLTADDGVHGFEPWQFDPRSGVVRLLSNMAADGTLSHSSFPSDYYDAGGKLLMSARDGRFGRVFSTGREPYWIPSPQTVPATAQPYSIGCAVDGVVSTLTPVSLPLIGQSGFGFQLQGPPFTLGILLVGFESAPFPVGPCFGYLNLPQIYDALTFVDGLGHGFVGLTIPGDDVFIGVELISQYAILGQSGGIGTSNPMRFRIGG